MIVQFTVPGKPGAKQRPQFSKKSKSVFTPAQTANYEQWVKLCYFKDCKDFEPLEGAIHAHIIAYYPIPERTSAKKTELMESWQIDPIVKPDLDNVAKIILDGLNKIAYKDDGHITRLLIEKHYSHTPRVVVVFTNGEDL